MLDGDEAKAKDILEVVSEVVEYTIHEDSLSLGIRYSPHELQFSKMLMFKWIKEGMSGRKT